MNSDALINEIWNSDLTDDTKNFLHNYIRRKYGYNVEISSKIK